MKRIMVSALLVCGLTPCIYGMVKTQAGIYTRNIYLTPKQKGDLQNITGAISTINKEWVAGLMRSRAFERRLTETATAFKDFVSQCNGTYIDAGFWGMRTALQNALVASNELDQALSLDFDVKYDMLKDLQKTSFHFGKCLGLIPYFAQGELPPQENKLSFSEARKLYGALFHLEGNIENYALWNSFYGHKNDKEMVDFLLWIQSMLQGLSQPLKQVHTKKALDEISANMGRVIVTLQEKIRLNAMMGVDFREMTGEAYRKKLDEHYDKKLEQLTKTLGMELGICAQSLENLTYYLDVCMGRR